MRHLFAVVFLMVLMLQLVPVASAEDPAMLGGTGVFVLTSQPHVCSGINNQFCIQESYRNALNFTVTGIVFMVVHNKLGQTVTYSTATIDVPGGQTAVAYNILFGLAPGSYSGTLFVTSTGGAAISAEIVLNFTGT